MRVTPVPLNRNNGVTSNLSYVIAFTMVDVSTIQKMGRKIGAEFKPEAVVLFGSYAYGKPSADSDIDILVVVPQDRTDSHLAAQIRLALPSQYPIDVIVHSRRRLHERLKQNDVFFSEIMEKGRILYEAGDGGMDREG